MTNIRFRCHLIAICLLVVLTVLSSRAYGQNSTSSISGTVTDPSGAVVPNAEVTATNVAEPEGQTVKTSSAGFYYFVALPAGTYKVTVQATGFKTFVRDGIRLDALSQVSLHVALEVGSPQTIVQVSASAVQVETGNGALGGVVTNDTIQQMPLNGRNILQVAALIPGVQNMNGLQQAGGGGNPTSAFLSVNGAGRETMSYTLDGGLNNQPCNCYLNITPAIDSVAEFRMVTDNYSAKYGLYGTGYVSIETKAGTQKFHGGAYDYARNDKIDALPWFTSISPSGRKVVAPYNQDIFGFNIGGPIFIPNLYNHDKKKSFFFVSEEWRRYDADDVIRSSVPTQAMRNGDFSSSPTLGSGGLNLDATATSVLSQLHPGVDCVPNSTTLNTACFDTNAAAIMNGKWPLPNNIAGGFLNYINNGRDIENQVEELYRVDHYFNEKYSLMAHVGYDRLPWHFPSFGNNPTGAETENLLSSDFHGMARFTAALSPTTINEISFTQTFTKFGIHGVNFAAPSGLSLTQVFPGADQFHRAPTIGISDGWAGEGFFIAPLQADDGNQVLDDDFTKIVGSHTLQAGGLFVFGLKRQNLFAQSNGTYSFSGVHTNDPMADYLLGITSSYFQQTSGVEGYFRSSGYQAYFQDDWKVNRKLTLNLGIRYYYEDASTMVGNAFTDFDPSQYSPATAAEVQPNGQLVLNSAGEPLTATGQVANRLDGVVFSGKNGVPAGIFATPKDTFGPRFGFAWDIFGDGKTSLRGGYGLSYGRVAGTPYNMYGSMLNYPYGDSVSLLNADMTNPTLGSTIAPKSSQSFSYLGPPNGLVHPVQLQTWSLTLQRQLMPGAVLQVAYVGNGSRHLMGNNDANAPLPVSAPSVNNPSCLSPGESASPAGGFNFDPCINAGIASPDYTRRYLGISSLSATGASSFNGTTNYDALQVGFKYRTTHGLLVDATYSWGHSLGDTTSSSIGANNAYGGSCQNSYDCEAEYGSTPWDRRNMFNLGYVYDLPILKNRKGAVGIAFGGWTFAGMTSIESGYDLTSGISGAVGLATRPDCVGSLGGQKTLMDWFNTSAFAYPQYGFYGSCGRGNIRGPGENTWNMAVYKSFPIREKANLQFRAEAFNVWNHPSFNNVDTTLGDPDDGVVTSAMQPRIMEFSLKLSF